MWHSRGEQRGNSAFSQVINTTMLIILAEEFWARRRDRLRRHYASNEVVSIIPDIHSTPLQLWDWGGPTVFETENPTRTLQTDWPGVKRSETREGVNLSLKWNTDNAFKERLSKSVPLYPHLYDCSCLFSLMATFSPRLWKWPLAKAKSTFNFKHNWTTLHKK